MKLLNTVAKYLSSTGLILVLGACAVVPKELDSLGQDDGRNFARKVIPVGLGVATKNVVMPNVLTEAEARLFYQVRFVRGDILRFRIAGMNQYDGLYQVTAEGTLDLPFSNSFSATNLSRADLIKSIEDELVRLSWFYKETVEVDLSLVEQAPINVSVVGAVFNPGRVSLDNQPITRPIGPVRQVSGAFSEARNIVSALGAAGGVRPDADTSEVILKRGDQAILISLQSLIDGNGFSDTPTLTHGDQIIVRSTGSVNSSLIKPSQITPPGMRVFMSNLTAPALNNAQSAVGSDSTRLPYGSSLLDSAISANCIGGTHQANASRSIVLVTRNFGSNQQLVVRRSINQLLANSSNQSVNPFMMPNDGIACYDSRFTNFRDVARGIGEVISPILLGRLL